MTSNEVEVQLLDPQGLMDIGPSDEPVGFEIGGGLVMLRPLSRDEAIEVGDEPKTKERDVLMLTYGLEAPKMSMQQIRAWQALPGKANVIEEISKGIAMLTGMLERDKVVWARFREQS